MTLESTLPWLSLSAAIAAVAVGGPARPRLGTGLRAFALGALGVFTYFRWLAPAAIPLALTLETIGQAALPQGPARWRRPALVFPFAAWLVLADLFWGSGEGRLPVVADGGKAALLLALLAGVAFVLRRIWTVAQKPRIGMVLAALALVLMGAAALTLDWGLWTALVGAGAIIVSQTLALSAERWEAMKPGGAGARLGWALDYGGYAVLAFAFLR